MSSTSTMSTMSRFRSFKFQLIPEKHLYSHNKNLRKVTFLNGPPKENLKFFEILKYFVHNLTLLQFSTLSILLTQCGRFIDIVDIDDVLST
jgi:hypothetical protein